MPRQSTSRRWRLSYRSVLRISVLSIACVTGSWAAAQDIQTWTDSSGKFKTKAEFVRLDGDSVVIKKTDGTEKTIPLSKLDTESQALAKTLSKKSSGATSSPGSSAAPSKSVKLADNMEPDAFVNLVLNELNKKNVMVLWDVLPAAKQKEVESIVAKAAKKIDSRTFDKIKVVRKSVFEIAKKQKTFIINSSVIAIPDDQKSQIEKSYPAIITAMESYISADLLDGKKLQKGELKPLLASYFGTLQKSLDDLAETLPQDHVIRQQLLGMTDIRTQMDIKVERISKSEAEVIMTPKVPPPNMPDFKPQPLHLTLADGRWLPKEMVQSWETSMQQAEATIQFMNPEQIHSSVMGGIGFITPTLNNLKNAKTQEEFDSILQGLQSLIPVGGPGMMPPGGPGGPGGFGPGGPSPGFGGNGAAPGAGRPGFGGAPPGGQPGGNPGGAGGQPRSE